MKTAIQLLLAASVSAELTMPIDYRDIDDDISLSCAACIYRGWHYYQAKSGEDELDIYMPPYYNTPDLTSLEVYLDSVQQYVWPNTDDEPNAAGNFFTGCIPDDLNMYQENPNPPFMPTNTAGD